MRALRASDAVLALLALALGCGGEAAPPATEAAPELDHAVIETQMHTLFTAIGASDCDTLGTLLPAIHSQQDCDLMVHHLHEEGFALHGIRQIVVDGRDPHSAIVHTLVEQGGSEREILVRATLTEGRWTFTL
jgi:hypothetical protein